MHRTLVSLGLLTLLVLACLSAVHADTATLSFDERVRAQEAIERVYHAHRIGELRAFEQATPTVQIEQEVTRYLRQSVALETIWGIQVTAEMLERELQRIANNTRFPERLQELFGALDDDPLLVRECLVRPVLVDRMIRRLFDLDHGVHAETRRQAESLHDQLVADEIDRSEAHPGRNVVELARKERGQESMTDVALTPDEFERRRERLSTSAGRIGPVIEERDRFVIEALLDQRVDGLRVAIYTIRKETWDGWWSRFQDDFDPRDVKVTADFGQTLPRPGGAETGTQPCASDDTWNNGMMDDLPDPRYNHTAVWTGTEMIVWGGRSGGPRLASGARYDPVTDSWAPVSMVDAPPGREQHAAVWTGTEMIVWGGAGIDDPYLNGGGRYNPSTDTWMPTSTTNAPAARRFHTAVWTGDEMIVWGGDAGVQFNTGGRYDPQMDSWTSTTTVSAPSRRSFHVAAWSGSEMIVWGGYGGLGSPTFLASGGRYDPQTDSWNPTALSGAPSARLDPSSVWTGSEMIVWGGSIGGTNYVSTGGRYDPATNTWTPTSSFGAPSARRNHAAVYDGGRMIVWGGDSGTFPQFLNDGARYDPVTDTWTATSSSGTPTGRRQHTAVWSGSEMIVWGGTGGNNLNTGGRYDPSADSWSPTFTADAPDARADHTAIWTGNVVVVWGGISAQSGILYLDTGGRYDPTMDQWTPTSTSLAPEGRQRHSAVWTGSEMIVWGGRGTSYSALASGGRYDPGADTWTSTTNVNAPAARDLHTAVWNGSDMIVWGGIGQGSPLGDGARYNPISNAWQPISTSGEPLGRGGHTAVWTGDEMIVWGGYNPSIPEEPPVYDTGGQYDSATDAWTSTPTVDAPLARRGHTAIWTGTRMVVWGGANNPPLETFLDSGAQYDPNADAWTPTSTVSAPNGRRDHSAIWTGQEIVVWGGTGIDVDRSGGRYDPDADSWTPTSIIGAPSNRARHTATWADDLMVVWGGDNGAYLNNGGRYVACLLSGDPPTFVKMWGTGGNAPGQLSGPHGLVVAPNGNLYVADTGNARVQRFTAEGEFVDAWGSFGTGDGQFNHPHGIGVDGDGNVFVAETGNNRVQKFTADGKFLLKWGSFGSGDGEFLHNHGLGVDRRTGHVYVADRDQNRVQKFTNDGVFVDALGSAGVGDGQFSGTNGVAVDGDGNVFVGDSSPRIQKFTSDGTFVLSWGSSGTGDGQFNFPRGLSVDAEGNVYVDDRNAHRMQKFTNDGVFITKWGSFGTAIGQFNFPYGIAAGADGAVFVADSGNHRIQKFVFVSGQSGRVPDGGDHPGPPLLLGKAGDDLTLNWGLSCQSTDSDYAVYEGVLGDFSSHGIAVCSTAGDTTATITPATGSAYYLVVPRGPTREGSYGTDSDGNERAAAAGPCAVQVIGPCG